jgi:cysteinyl-tRNA synthetase
LVTDTLKPGSNERVQALCVEALQKYESAMDDDLNTAQALAAIFDWVREINTALVEKSVYEADRDVIINTMDRLNEVLKLWEPPDLKIDEEIRSLVEQRDKARRARNFDRADQIRAQLYEMGYIIEDTREGVRWKKR